MWSADGRSEQRLFRTIGSQAPVSMCRLALILTLLSIQVHGSSEAPPRLARCREIYKSKEASEDFLPPPLWSTCQVVISFPIPQGETVNLTDTRNCENYYSCQGLSCRQCPCPSGQTFNPRTLRCDSDRSQCECPSPTTPSTSTTTTPTTTTTTTKTTTTHRSTSKTAGTTIIITAGTEGSNANDKDDDNNNDKVSTEVIIIAGIVSATVIIIVVIVMAVFLWQKGRNRNSNHSLKSLPPPSSHTGYSPAIPASERHVYAEIDERMIAGDKHWQHGGSLRAPPLPDHQPPISSTPSPCPLHSHTDSGVGSTDTSFTNNYPKRAYNQPPQHNCIKYIRDGHIVNCCPDNVYHLREDSSASSESQYSNSSHQTSLDSHEIDMRTPLHACKQNYMSKQVYI